MYRIIVKNRGKYNNVTMGCRYCFTKKSAKRLIDLFFTTECDIEVEKLIHIHSDIFCWTYCKNDKVFEYFELKRHTKIIKTVNEVCNEYNATFLAPNED